MNGQIRDRFKTFLGAIFLISVLFFPDLSLGNSYPAIQFADLLLPLLIGSVLPQIKTLPPPRIYSAFFLLIAAILLSMAVNGRLLILQDLFEIFKVLKWAIVVLFFSTLSIEHVYQQWVKGLFLALMAVNLLHYFNIFNFNAILTNYYHGGIHIEYFGLNSLKEPAAKRMVGLVGNPNINSVVFTLFSIALFPFQWTWKQLAWFFATVLMVFLCQSKTAVLTLAILLLAIPILQIAKLSLKTWGTLALGIIGMYLISWTLATNGFKYPLYSNVLFVEGGEQLMQTGSAKGRLEVWRFLGKMVLEQPIFGHGGNKAFFYSNKLYAENEYLLITWRYGIIGIIAFLCLYWRPWTTFFHRANRTKYALPLLAIIALLVTSMTNNPLMDRTVSMLFFVIIGLSYGQMNRNSDSSATSRKTRRLLLIGSSNGSAHLKNYYELVQSYFDEVLIVSNQVIDYSNSITVPFGLKNPITLWRSIFSIEKAIERFQPDCIHVHQANVYAFAAIRANKQGIPLVLTTWGSDVLLLPQSNFINRWMVRYNLKHASFITADASFMGERITELSGRKDTVIANFGIDLPDMKQDVSKEKIIYSNRMHESLYNVSEILSGTANFLNSHSDWTLIIAGQGAETEKLKFQAKEKLPEQQVQFVGFLSREENISNYRRASIFISIPSSDGTAVSLLEAMASGCIPVVSDLPANREWVMDGKNGIIVKDNEVDEAVHRAMHLSPFEVARINQQIVIDRASKTSMRKVFCGIYDQLIKR